MELTSTLKPITPQPDSQTSHQKLQIHYTSISQPMVISYGECLKNHAATVGGHALDGCGEFMPSLTATPTDPTSLNCAACGCHRNFHRREPDDLWPNLGGNRRYHPYRLCQPMPRSPSSSPHKARSPSSPVPLPISHIPPPLHFSAPHMLLALSTAAPPDEHRAFEIAKIGNPKERKRKRTKFSGDQKEKMYSFSEKMGWKIRKSDERLVEEFCNEIGIGKRVLRVWMHNNKYVVGGKGERGRASQSCDNGGNDSKEST